MIAIHVAIIHALTCITSTVATKYWALPDAHQVSWFIGRDLRADVLQNTVHVFLRLTNRQTADSVAIKANLYQTWLRCRRFGGW